jgi:hypothetical protein
LSKGGLKSKTTKEETSMKFNELDKNQAIAMFMGEPDDPLPLDCEEEEANNPELVIEISDLKESPTDLWTDIDLTMKLMTENRVRATPDTNRLYHLPNRLEQLRAIHAWKIKTFLPRLLGQGLELICRNLHASTDPKACNYLLCRFKEHRDDMINGAMKCQKFDVVRCGDLMLHRATRNFYGFNARNWQPVCFFGTVDILPGIEDIKYD